MRYHYTMNKFTLSLILAMSCRLLWAGDVSGQGVATLTLQTRYERMLISEVPQYLISLRNNSTSNLIYVADGFDALGIQLFMKVRKGSQLIKRHDCPYQTVENNGKWDELVEMPTSELQPNHSMTWRSEMTDLNWGMELGAQAIQAQVLVGPSQWVSSLEVPVCFLPGDVDQFPKVFTYNYVLGRGTNQMWFYQGPVDDKEYLFSKGSFRICEVPKGSTPKFRYEPETYSIRISFDAVNVSDVIYDQRRLRVLSPEEFSKEYGPKAPKLSKPEETEPPIAPVVLSNKFVKVVPPAPSSGVQSKADAKSWSFSHIIAVAFLLLLIASLVYRVYTAKR